jgi:hypothetical protein
MGYFWTLGAALTAPKENELSDMAAKDPAEYFRNTRRES